MRLSRPAVAGLLGVLALSGCGAPAPTEDQPGQPGGARHVQVSGTFSTTPGNLVTYDEALVPVGAEGTVTGMETGDGVTVTLGVSGLQPGRAYGAHAHTMPCGAEGADAGPHFQREQDPVSPSVDPAFANPQNEIWLDFTTDADGAGMATTTVPWQFPADRRAQSVIIHAMSTATEPGKAGTAGDRLACITVAF